MATLAEIQKLDSMSQVSGLKTPKPWLSSLKYGPTL